MRAEPFDPIRLFLGNTPPIFLVEVALRMLFLYLVLLAALRVMGRRMSSQLTRNEMLALVSLAAGVGPALQDPQQGILPPLIIAIWVAAVQRGVAYMTFRSRRADEIANGKSELLLQDGRLQLQALRRNSISRERLFAELRSRGFLQMGAIERVYIESDGSFSTIPGPKNRPGLSIVPEWDPELAARQSRDPATQSCGRCGSLKRESDSRKPCRFCRALDWRAAVHA
jgi:uncharacterized membrane protein YcaP (DUF421 family)